MNTVELLPQPDCTAGCDEGWVYTFNGMVRVESKCIHCKGTGKEPPLSERELEERGQEALPL